MRLFIFGKEYEYDVKFTGDKRSEKRWIAFGKFGENELQSYGLTSEKAAQRLKEKAEIYLDQI